MTKKSLLIWTLVLFLGLGTVALRKSWRKSNLPMPSLLTISPSPTLSAIPTAIVPEKGTAETSSILTSEQTAACQIGGQIKFISPTMAEHLNAYLTYTGIDSPARLIKWQVTPNQDLKIGPNLAASLKLPDGRESINIVLPEKPIASNYKLSASMTYGRLINHEVKIFEVQCQGQTKVLLNF